MVTIFYEDEQQLENDITALAMVYHNVSFLPKIAQEANMYAREVKMSCKTKDFKEFYERYTKEELRPVIGFMLNPYLQVARNYIDFKRPIIIENLTPYISRELVKFFTEVDEATNIAQAVNEYGCEYGFDLSPYAKLPKDKRPKYEELTPKNKEALAEFIKLYFFGLVESSLSDYRTLKFGGWGGVVKKIAPLAYNNLSGLDERGIAEIISEAEKDFTLEALNRDGYSEEYLEEIKQKLGLEDWELEVIRYLPGLLADIDEVIRLALSCNVSEEYEAKIAELNQKTR